MTNTVIRFQVSTTTVTVCEPAVMTPAYAAEMPDICNNACVTLIFPHLWSLPGCCWIIIPCVMVMIGMVVQKTFARPREKAIILSRHRQAIRESRPKDEKVGTHHFARAKLRGGFAEIRQDGTIVGGPPEKVEAVPPHEKVKIQLVPLILESLGATSVGLGQAILFDVFVVSTLSSPSAPAY